ncbi:hypothetical protein EIP91_009559 [Steccherinum ochraceum]|uniref:E3 ubiquitin-protein ligase listerin n=1 Tax=Steccherinum ochraceum TaxID=92696 RepID=A0A4R0RRG0_9APHY|nr:hypothetical protein EIP91_009559 [Steccherinum ochraceum]
MAKGVSSASRGTRKKHAKKAAAANGDPEGAMPKEKKPKGKKGKEVRKKEYIPPVKPAPALLDPLDTLGIAQRISPELLVVLRRLAKKDSITKRRALEELQADWVDKARVETSRVHELVEVIPVWFHHMPALFIHPSRRIRTLAVSLYSSLLHLPSPMPDQLLFFMQEIASSDQAELILGTWRTAAHDVDRQISSSARQSWDSFVSIRGPSIQPETSSAPKMKLSLDFNSFSTIWSFVQRMILDPSAIYLSVNPPAPVVPPPPTHRNIGGRAVVQAKKDEESGTRSRGEDDEENELDRNALLRIGALGAAEWALNTLVAISQDEKQIEEFISPLDNPALWTALHSSQNAPFVTAEIQSFGWNQPGVRKSAWSLIETIMSTCKAHITPLLSSLSTAILRSAWTEIDPLVRRTMWKPLLMFIREFPNSWELEASAHEQDDDADDEGSASEDEDASEPAVQHKQPPASISKAYPEFLQFLELGCGGSPVQGYPAVLIILSTIPPRILASVHPPVPSFLTSFWAAVDGRALSGLDRTEASLAFLTSLLECVVFLARRILKDPAASVLLDGTAAETARSLVSDQVSKVWEEITSSKLKLDTRRAADELAKMLQGLQKTDEGLFDAAWDTLTSSLKEQLIVTDKPLPDLVSTSLTVFSKRFERGSHPAQAAATLTSDVLHTIVSLVGDILEKDEVPSSEYINSLLAVLDTFGSLLFQDEELAPAIDDTVVSHTSRILAISPPLLFLYFSHRKDEQLCNDLWGNLLLSISQDNETSEATLKPLLEAVENGSVPAFMRPKADELEKTVSLLLAEALTRHEADAALDVVRRILRNHASICETFSAHADVALHDNLTLPLETFAAPLTLLNTIVETHDIDIFPLDSTTTLLPNLLLFAHLVPRFRAMDASLKTSADVLWRSWLSQATEEDINAVNAVIKSSVRDVMSDCFALARPLHLIQLVSSRASGLDVDVVKDIFPSRKELDAMLDTLPTSPADPSMAVLDPMILPGEADEEGLQSVTDSFGYSSYARIVVAISFYLMEDRQAAKENIWMLRHLLATSQYAYEVLQIPSTQSAVFGSTVAPSALQEFTTRTQQLLAYLLTSTIEDGWLPRFIASLSSGQRSSPSNDIGDLIYDLVLDGAGRDSMRESRILRTLLQHTLAQAGPTKQDGDQLIAIARKLETRAPYAALALVYSVTKFCPESPRLDRYRNELAAGLFGVPASKANTNGLWLLRRLVAVAPDPESDIIFLPTPRAVNLMKACQQWIGSDEDIDEELEIEMTSVFIHLAPILQNVPGAHWDFIFDIMDNNLEGASLDDPATLPALARTLRLFLAIQELAASNKTLHATWQEKERTQLTIIRDLISQKPVEKKSGPLSACRELAITICQNLPESLIEKETLSQMCHLVTDSSQSVQQMAYHMLRGAATKHTEYIVVEAAVDTETEVKPVLPDELIDILQQTIQAVEEKDELYGPSSFANLLAWMLIFDLFTNASLKVKSSYIEHLQRLNLISDHFLPHVLGILGLYGGVTRAFKLDIWAVEEFYLDLYSSETPHSLQLLAAHLYFRALMTVPSLFRSWLLDCRDRQLSSAVTSYTSNYFSPAIIRTELAQVKSTATAAELVDENMKVKVANAVNEVTASYAVDEYQLELKITLPSDWPLHSIEIQDKRIGVSEDRWRAWILGVRQILTFRSGTIVDGLSFFKKNVASHFEGQTECAICYSMISATDSSLPKKPCKTCKNRFHAGCLYKWFSTSHSSSCPLCRSEIMN